MILKGFRYRVPTDPRGDISSGRKNEKGLPEKLPYFNVEDFPEVKEMYGDKPTEIVLFFPTDNLNDFLSYRHEKWGAKGDKAVLIRYCDNEECIHRIAEEVGGIKYEAGEISECICDALPENDPKLCQARFWFKAYIANPKTLRPNNPLTYRFHSSRNSAEHVISMLRSMKDLNMGVLRNIPFRLTVKIVQDQFEAKKNFPVWDLIPIGMLDEIRESTERFIEGKGLSAKALPSPKVEDSSPREVQETKPGPKLPTPVLNQVQHSQAEVDDKENQRRHDYKKYLTALQECPSTKYLTAIGAIINQIKDQFTPMDLEGLREAYNLRRQELNVKEIPAK